jgi:hypothetical protein
MDVPRSPGAEPPAGGTASKGAVVINGSVSAPALRGVERVQQRSRGPVDLLHDRAADDPVLSDYAWVVLVEPVVGNALASSGEPVQDDWAVEVSSTRPPRVEIPAGSERGQLYALYHVAKCLEMGRRPETWPICRRPLVPHRYAWISAGNVWSPVCRPDQFDRAIIELPDMGFNGVLLTCNATHGTSVGRQTIPVELTDDGVAVDRFKLPAFLRMFDWFRSFGLEISLFQSAYLPPGFTKDEVREHYAGRRDLPGLADAIRRSSRDLAAAIFEHLPQLDSLLFHSLECEWMWGNSVSMFPSQDDATSGRAFEAYLDGLTGACEEAGKDLLFWTHVSGVSARQLRLMHRLLARHPSVVVVEDAAWPNNMWPHAPVMGHLAPDLQEAAANGRLALAVNTTDGEYCGAGSLPTAYPDGHVRSARAASDLGAELAYVRINEQAMTPLGTLEDCNAIHVIGASEQWWDPPRPMDELWGEWCTRRFGAAAAPAVASALRKSEAFVLKGVAAGDMPLMDHNGIGVYSWRPGQRARAWDLFARPGERIVDKPYDELADANEIRVWEIAARGVAIDDFLAAQDEAVAAVRQALREIESVRADLAPEDYAYLRKCFGDALPMLDAVRHAALGARASAAYLDDPVDANRRALGDACDAMEAAADRIEREHGVDFHATHYFMKATLNGRTYGGYGVPIALRVISHGYRELL